MDGMGFIYDCADARLAPTINLWRMRDRMPRYMHETKSFSFTRNGEEFVCVLNISRHVSTVSEYRRGSKGMSEYRSSKINDMYFENGTFVIKTKKRLLTA